jgi:hypothetical protein
MDPHTAFHVLKLERLAGDLATSALPGSPRIVERRPVREHLACTLHRLADRLDTGDARGPQVASVSGSPC